jgi:exopolyphosphatase/guanosine-5'-triphosphate,3'-diphosphate pyrophosphatase
MNLSVAVGREFGMTEQELLDLEYAALLHDIGQHISYLDRYKHTYYLIKNGGLRGFTPLEVEVLANVARYHRRTDPRKKHPGFASLPRAERDLVRVLAAHLRLADALDRSHRQVVKGLGVTFRGGALRIRAYATGDASLELWGAPRRAELLGRVLDADVRVDVAEPPAAAPAPLQLVSS